MNKSIQRTFPFLLLLFHLLLGLSACNQASTENTPSDTGHPPASPAVDAGKPTDVIVIGAGLSGLTAAFELQKAGVSYRVLEREPRVGGRVRTHAYAEGLTDEAGLAEFWASNPALKMVKDLKLETEVAEAAMSSVILNGQVRPFVQATQNEYLASIFNPAEMKAWQKWQAKMAEMYQKIKARQFDKDLWALKDISFAKWVAKQGLTKKMQDMVRLHIEPETGISWDAIGALDGIAEWHIFLGEGERPHHIVGGNQKLVEALADRVGRPHVQLNEQVTHIDASANGVSVTTRDLSTLRHRTYKGRFAVFTIPLYRLFEIHFTPPLSQKKMQAIYSQGYGAYFAAHVLVDAAASKYWVKDGVSTLALLTDGPLGVIYGRSTRSTAKDQQPPAKYHMLSLLVTGSYAEQFNARTGALDPVRGQLSQAFEKLWPGFTKHIRQWEFHRYHPRAIAAWPVGRSRFDELSEAIRQPENSTYLAGDFTESSHSDGAVYSALRVTKDIAAKLKK